MTKKVIFNVILNLGIILMIMSTVAAYRVGHVLFFGLSIALIVVFIYLKVVLLKYVSRTVRAQSQEQKVASQPQRKAKKKKLSK
ncbi:DUF6358 family protein [Sphingobacterium sp. lm-10]|uniref:DUF6358 family protein n=1 Tax=Sphingobacterium sp. lm-10 TaxID=2944904 RepID=UPI002020F24F|nr:DUF6358 family protein [Sphingobacterium sp. lm-10]MCL7988263.1 DUF6358 family protein [Sphingobacterium sp. lm-10]